MQVIEKAPIVVGIANCSLTSIKCGMGIGKRCLIDRILSIIVVLSISCESMAKMWLSGN